MNRQRIVAHCQVKNEEVWVWYAVMSVIDYVDEIMVWDTGSTDTTVSQIKSITNPKIKFKTAKDTPNETELAAVRQEMIDESARFDWMMILDGDEIWPNSAIDSATEFIHSQGINYDSIVTPTLNCLGDVFHVSPSDAGRYKLIGKTGHFNIRFINLHLAGLHVASKNGGLLSYYDQNDGQIQDRTPEKIAFLDTPYLHMTHLTRSLNRKNETSVFWRAVKKKYEWGQELPDDFAYPACFYYPKSNMLLNPFSRRSAYFSVNAFWQTPLRKLKRKINL